MDILYLLIPLSVVLVLMIIGALAWALYRGQFDDLEHQGELVFDPEEAAARAAALRASRRPQTPGSGPATRAPFPERAPLSANPNVPAPPQENAGKH